MEDTISQEGTHGTGRYYMTSHCCVMQYNIYIWLQLGDSYVYIRERDIHKLVRTDLIRTLHIKVKAAEHCKISTY